jgi:hypothetical protein
MEKIRNERKEGRERREGKGEERRGEETTG